MKVDSFLKLEVNVAGVTELSKLMRRLNVNLKNFRPVFDQFTDVLCGYMEKRFEVEGAFQGLQQWTELSEPYAIWKKMAYGEKPILERTGRLKESFTEKNEDHVEEITDESMAWGSKVPYGIYHQTGGGILPKREIIMFSAELKKEFIQILRKYIRKVYDKSQTGLLKVRP